MVQILHFWSLQVGITQKHDCKILYQTTSGNIWIKIFLLNLIKSFYPLIYSTLSDIYAQPHKVN